MIIHQEIKNLVTEWGLREGIIEKITSLVGSYGGLDQTLS